MSYIPQLIPIYAANTVQAVKDHRELLETPFVKTLEELSRLQGFSLDQDFVREQKLTIEADEANYKTADKALQVSECLKSLLRLAIYDESPATTVALMIETQAGLLRAIYGGGWKPEQLQHFDFVAGQMKAWLAYFLSYSNSGARVVNDTYASIIRTHADPQVRKSRDPNDDNILADAIINWLDRNKVGRRSFYDRKRLEAGDFIRAQIEPAVNTALAFVQLVHLDTFTSPKKVNWSFEEYTLFTEFNKKILAGREDYRTAFEGRLIPIIAGDPVKLKLPNDKLKNKDYWPWRDRLLDQALYLELPVNKVQFEGVMAKLESAITRRAYRIIESVQA